jgi:hypothetical protein
MRIKLCEPVLDTLIDQGYEYVLSKVYPVTGNKLSVFLTPIKEQIAQSDFPVLYDGCIDIKNELSHMICEIEGLQVYVKLNSEDVTHLKYKLLKTQPAF